MIRVLVVDDSSFMRKSLTHILKSDEEIKVIDVASDGKEAVRKTKQLHPDVITLDLMMPVMDGLTALAHIMAEIPTPVLVISALNKSNAEVVLKSLEIGAIDYIPKPSGFISYDIETITDLIIGKVKIAAGVNVSKVAFKHPKSYELPKVVTKVKKEIIAIGASTGGPRAISEILARLSGKILSNIFVIQHMSPEFVVTFAKRLRNASSLNVSVAGEGEIIKPGSVFIAPGGVNSVIVNKKDKKVIEFAKKNSTHLIYPSIDFAMESVASAYGENALGVLLTGIGNDGALGMKAIKEAGGATIAEDRSTSITFGMPKAAIDLGVVDQVLPLQLIAPAILKMS